MRIAVMLSLMLSLMCTAAMGATIPPKTVGVGLGGAQAPQTLYVSGGVLYDTTGVPFRIRGVNKSHWDQISTGIANSKANTIRWEIDFTRSAASNVALVQSVSTGQHEIAIVGNWTATCSTDPATLSAAVSTWVSQAAQWTTLSKFMIVNIANEWGPANSTVWRDSYISAISSLRTAGYTGPLLIDTGNCGQDFTDLQLYAGAVAASDAEHNIMFAIHLYGNAQSALDNDWLADLAALQATDNTVFIVGEFGPGRNIGPSPTLVTPAQVITAAESAGLGWLPWAWDDNNLPGCTTDGNWFDMTVNCSAYTMPSDLTAYGQDVVLNGSYGIAVLARPANGL